MLCYNNNLAYAALRGRFEKFTFKFLPNRLLLNAIAWIHFNF